MTAFRGALFCTPVLLAAALIGTASGVDAGVPAGATRVTMSAGELRTNIDVHLRPAGSIAGVVRSIAGSRPITDAYVAAYLGNRQVAAGAVTAGGHYVIAGLPRSETGYAVCMHGSSVIGGGASTSGYLSRCYRTAAWGDGSIPSAARKVPLAAGQVKVGIDLNLPSAAAIAGRVTSASGRTLRDVTVIAINRGSGRQYVAHTTKAGKYRIGNLTLASGKGYTVCFDARTVRGGTGFVSRCYRTVPWNPSAVGYPSTAVPVSLTAGRTRSGVTVALPRGGAIAGRVADATNGTALQYFEVVAFTGGGTRVNSTTTDDQGGYRIRGLPAAGADRVCAYPRTVTRADSAVRFHGKCWRNATWRGGSELPRGTTGVRVTPAQTRSDVDLRLGRTVVRLGSISGYVREDLTGKPVEYASVLIMTPGGRSVGKARSDATGRYRATGLPGTSTGYVVCARATSATRSPLAATPATGWAPRCNNDVFWDGTRPPTGAKKWTLSAGGRRADADIRLHVGAEITGTVAQFDGATPIPFANVYLFTPTGAVIDGRLSASDGTYAIKRVPPTAAGWTICFNSAFDNRGAPANWRPQCFSDVGWDGRF